MIKSIELKNWKTHGSTRLEFAKGTNILIGKMGAGKSSVMDAISFALFGTFPAVQHKRSSMNRLIRNKPSQQKKGIVKLEFSVGKDEYTVTREINFGGSPSAKIEKNGTYLQSQPERVNEEIEKALKIDYDLFSRAVYSEQNGLDYFLTLPSNARKKQIDGLLGLDKFALAQENATSLISKLKDMVEEGEKTAEDFDITKAKQQLDGLLAEQEKLIVEKKEVEASSKKLESDTKDMQERLTSLKKEYSRKLLLVNEMAELKSKSKTLQIEIEKIEKKKLGLIADAKKEFEKVNKELNELTEKERLSTEFERKATGKTAKLQADVDKIQKDLEEKTKLSNELKEKNRSEIEKKIEEHTKELEELGMQAASSSASKAESEKWVKELEKHMSKCPICERDLTKEMVEKLVQEKKAATQKAISDLKKFEELSSAKKVQLTDLNRELNRLTLIADRIKGHGDVDTKLTNAKAELLKAQEEGNKAKIEKDRISKSALALWEELAKVKASVEALTRMEGYIAEKGKNDILIETKQKEHDSLKADEKTIDELQKEFTAISSQLSKHKANLEAVDRYLKDKVSQITEKKEEIERINKIYEDVKRKKAIGENVFKFRNALQETQTVMRTKLILSINSIMNEIWPQLYPYGDYTGIILEANEADYVLKVKTIVDNQPAWEEVESIASGGERSIACLAMRIAFALVLVPNLKWLILDEPTHNIDQQGLSKFINVFNEMLPSIVDQIFIITHDDVLKQVQNAKIYTLDRNKEEHKETEVVG